MHGYATIETDNAVKVVPKAEAAKSHSQVRLGSDPAGIPKTDTLVRQIIPLQYADAAEISEIITPILSPGAQIATYPRTNSLMITDTSANINHIAEVIRQLDVEGSKEKVLLFPWPTPRPRSSASRSRGSWRRARRPGACPGRGGSRERRAPAAMGRASCRTIAPIL